MIPGVASLIASCAALAAPWLLLAWAATRALRRSPAATRHLVWCTAIAGLLMLPLLRVLGLRTLTLRQDRPATAGVVVSAPPHRAQSGGDLLVVALWLAGAMATGGWLLVGRLGASYAALRSRPCRDRRVLDVARSALCAVGLRRLPELRLGEPGTIPSVTGVWRQSAVLPVDAVSWPPERLHHVLVHEFAHVRRRDGIAQLVGALALAAYWFHPGVWLALRGLTNEQERACDDEVLAAGVPAPDYAQRLVDLVRGLRAPQAGHSHALAMLGGATLAVRVPAILDAGAVRVPPPLLLRTALVGALACGGTVLAGVRTTPALDPSIQGAAAPFAQRADQAAPMELPLRGGRAAVSMWQMGDKRFAVAGGLPALALAAQDPRLDAATRDDLRRLVAAASQADYPPPKARP